MALLLAPDVAGAAEAAAGLVERGGELAALAQAAGGLASTGRFLLVSGPVGIGKTSLLAAAGSMAGASGCRVLRARGVELERQLSFGLVRQLFELPLALAGEQQRARWLAGTGAAAAVLGSAAHDEAFVGDFAVLNGLFWLVSNLCEDGPLALLVDDLHWADRGSLRFLTYLQPRLEGLPVLVVGATRRHEPGSEQHLLGLLEAGPAGVLLRPQALTPAGSAAVVSAGFGTAAEQDFLAACHTATGGNPLMLRALVAVAASEGIRPTAGSAGLLPELGAGVLGARIEARLSQLPPASAGLARAVALLGKDTPTDLATTLAGLGAQQAAEAVRQLDRVQILASQGDTLEFVHPLVRTAVYEQIPADERIAGHLAAATLLASRGADPERIATHLLRIPATGNPHSADILRRSAGYALRRGSADAALAYLTRCLDEPLDPPARLRLQQAAGELALGVDLSIAERHLSDALRAATGPLVRAEIAFGLSRAYYYRLGYHEARQVCVDAMTWLPPDDADLRRRFQGALVTLGTSIFRHHELPVQVQELRELEPQATAGGRMLDAALAMYDGTANEPSAVARAERAISDGVLMEHPAGDTALLCGWWVLLAADRDDAMESIEIGLKRAHQAGSFFALSAALTWRGLGWTWQGQLTEAVSDYRRAIEAAETAQIQIARVFTGPWLADALIEQGDLDGAAEALRWVGAPDPLPPGMWHLYLNSQAQLLRLRGQHEAALAAALAAGERFAGLGGTNPAFVPWRSEAALCLHVLGRSADASHYALQELELARHWGAPRAIGRALRVAGLVSGQRAGLDMLAEAVHVLAASHARLEYAKALVDLGAALRRTGRRADAKGYLTNGLEQAERCGAQPVTRQAAAELRAAGETVRPAAGRTLSLTPSEHRVAQLAVNGLSNRDIAQQLFVTIKTVELHLGNAYRKLGISRRDQLHPLLANTST
jgi:DNA-binding NarL/FixJ family response regulator